MALITVAIVILLLSNCLVQLILPKAKLFGKTPEQEREPKLLRLTDSLNNSKGSL